MRPVIFELPEIVLLLSQASALIVKREEAVANIVVYQFLPEELVVHEPIALDDKLQEKVLFADFECP